MPAYLDLSLQFWRKDLRPGFVGEWDAALRRAGVEFRSGACEETGWSQEEIAAWNQKKLEENFELGFDEGGFHDYKQSCYSFGGYSKARGCWMNQYPEKDTFSFFLLVPEGEVLECNLTFHAGAVAQLLELAKRLWQFPAVRAIQTELELDDGPVGLSELRRGMPPSMAPFAILERSWHRYEDGSRAVELTAGRPGILLIEDDMISSPME